MKVFTLFSMLALTLVQEGLCTHLETCDCHEIQELVNTTVHEAAEGLEKRLGHVIYLAIKNINATDESALENLENRLTDTVERLLTPIKKQLDYHLPLAAIENSEDNPAASCKALLLQHPNAPSGDYWITKSGSAVRMYCSMNLTCSGHTGGWMRVANLDMRDVSHSCPSGFSLISSPKRLCGINSIGCISSTVSVQGVQYGHVCGRIIAYQNEVPIAFGPNINDIDRNYVFGVSLTHGQSPRKHIWTFAGAPDETSLEYRYKCPCINPGLTQNRVPSVPSFIGNDYFCDTAVSSNFRNLDRLLHLTNPLWDGKGCGPTNTCCSFNTPPWFNKELPSATTDDIEMRMCQPSGSSNSFTPIEIMELYVQ